MRKGIIGSIAVTAMLLIGFQNCGKLSFSTDTNASKSGVGAQGDTDGSGGTGGTGGTGGGTGGTGDGGTGGGGTGGGANAPSIAITAESIPVLKAKDAKLAIVTKYVDAVTYSCLSQAADQAIVRKGQLNLVDGIASLVVPVDQDVRCTFLAVSGDKTATTVFDIPVDCGDALYKDEVAHVCRADFACKSVVVLTPTAGNALIVPKRTTDGICYAYKLMDGVALSPSAGDQDTDVIARKHGQAGMINAYPYKLGSMIGSFTLGGTRHVSIGSDSAGKNQVGVDNFLLVGVSPVGLGNPQDYQVAGTADASAYVQQNGAGVDSNNVYLKQQPIAVHAFASGGTASFDPIEVTSAAKASVKYGFDIRALDCGGSRYLSPLYLLFR